MAGAQIHDPGLAVRPYDFDLGLINAVKRDEKPLASIYPFDHRAVVAGRGSRLDRELNLDRVQADQIPVYRRAGGGCAVFLDPGNLIVSLAFPAQGFGDVAFLFNQAGLWLRQGLVRAGIVGVYQDGISDLVIQGQKIGGSCFHRSRGLAYYSASLLVCPDLGAVAAYLAHPPREPGYRLGRSHQDFLAGLNRFFPGLTIDQLRAGLTAHLTLDRLGRAA